jgi:PPOX class probable F420-dependent enzyme
MPSLDRLGAEKYVLLTTFRKDGRAVPTALWVVPDGDGIAFWTPVDSGKVKRLRNSGRVTVAPCDLRGTPQGEAVEAQARIGEPSDTVRVRRVLARKYGLLGRLTLWGSKLRRGTAGTVAILVSAA